jgi:hypothetical protein
MKSTVSAGLICAVLGMVPATAGAQTKWVIDAFKSPNPLSSLMNELQGCTLVRPLYPQFDLAGDVNEASVGNMTMPVKVANATIIDVGGAEDSSASICKVTKFRPNAIKEPGKWPFEFGAGFRDDLKGSIKLNLGNWLKLLDFEVKDLTSIKVGIQGGTITYDDAALGQAALDIKLHKAKACIAWNMKTAKMISRNCIGHVYFALEAAKGLSLNALDLTFSKLTVGLKADWIREVKGTLENCESKDAGILGKKPADPKIADNKKADAGTGEAKKVENEESKVQIKTEKGTVVITPKSLNLVLPASIKDVTPKTNPAAKPQPEKTADNAKSDKPAAEKPATGNSCITAVLYRTNVPVIYGVRLRDAADFKKWANK